VEAQNAKNDFIKKEIASLDKQIDQIRQLREQVQALLARKQIIESLQQDRAEAVLMLSELTRQTPEGVYLVSLRQEGTRVSLLGYAQSSARVSTLMRNIEASPWLENPYLKEVKAVNQDNRRLSEFGMDVFLKRTASQEAAQK
jgi:type IV pilus assembly protein PilN